METKEERWKESEVFESLRLTAPRWLVLMGRTAAPSGRGGCGGSSLRRGGRLQAGVQEAVGESSF